MHISRHYLTIEGADGPRCVHYRRCGEGPPLLMVHQSPRSSAEYEALMRDWGAHFTCIAPDTPGFGQSDPLSKPAPEIDDFADAIVEFADAVGLPAILGYGFHSGGIILVTAMKRQLERFAGLAVGGYAIWTEDERKTLGEPYIPPCIPLSYGEHLTWLWNRILEQSWYFPWYNPCDANRLRFANDDPHRVDLVVREMLDSGDAYRLGYGAVLRGPRDIPPTDTVTPPVRITAYEGDPLKEHLDRLGDLPAGWEAFAVDKPADHHAASLEFLRAHRGEQPVALAEDGHQGFVAIRTDDFDGLIHWNGPANAKRLAIHAPGQELALVQDADAIRIDLPGHGLSSAWNGEPPTDWRQWQKVIDVVAAHFGTSEIALPATPLGDADRLFPDLTPDRFGSYLTTAWSIVRAQHLFKPWYLADADHVIPIAPDSLDPANLAIEHRALIRATAANAMTRALETKD